MLQLNLLSPQAKKSLTYERYRRAVLALGGSLAAALAVFLVLLSPTYFFLILQKGEVLRLASLEERSEESRKSREIELLIREVNSLSRRIRELESSRSAVSSLLAEVATVLPQAVTLSSFQFEEKTRELDLTGHAATRAVFLEFLSILRASPRFSSVTSPVTNIIRERDIDFTLQALLR